MTKPNPMATRLCALLADVAEPSGPPTTDTLEEIAGLLDRPLDPHAIGSRIAAAFRGMAATMQTEEDQEKTAADSELEGRKQERAYVMEELKNAMDNLKWMDEAWALDFREDFESNLSLLD